MPAHHGIAIEEVDAESFVTGDLAVLPLDAGADRADCPIETPHRATARAKRSSKKRQRSQFPVGESRKAVYRVAGSSVDPNGNAYAA